LREGGGAQLTLRQYMRSRALVPEEAHSDLGISPKFNICEGAGVSYQLSTKLHIN